MMESPDRMPRYDVRNDGAGPYAVFYCDRCHREYRSRPTTSQVIAQDIGRQAMGGLLRGFGPLGRTAARNVRRDNPRYVYTLTDQQLEAAWNQVAESFNECPTCGLIVCRADFDLQTGYCNEDSPRRTEIAEAQAGQAAGVLKGLAGAFGLGEVVRNVTAANAAAANMARCPRDGMVAPAGTKFCPECGSPMEQPVVETCANCGVETKGAKFCPECGNRIG